MGKSDIAVKQMFRRKERFADLFNGTVFKGKQVVKACELEEIDSETSVIVSDKKEHEKGIQKYRDITMRWTKGAELSVLAVENQDKIHYAMPVRTMFYDSLGYTDQIRLLWQNRKTEEKVTEEEYLSRFRKEDKLYPIISLVFYYGLNPWDGSKDLYGMFQQSELFRTEKVLKRYVTNYRLNLIEAGNLGDVSCFRTDLQLILGMLEYKEKKEDLQNYVNAHKDYFEKVDVETCQAMQALLHSKSKLNTVVRKTEKGESINMCKALDDLYNSGIEQGTERGISALIKTCEKFDISKENLLEQLITEFSLEEDKALEYMKKYSN